MRRLKLQPLNDENFFQTCGPLYCDDGGGCWWSGGAPAEGTACGKDKVSDIHFFHILRQTRRENDVVLS